MFHLPFNNGVKEDANKFKLNEIKKNCIEKLNNFSKNYI